MDRMHEAIPGLPIPSDVIEQSEDEDPFGSSEAIIDLLVKYGKCKKRSIGVVQREEELLLELLARTKKERIQLQYMGARPTIHRQSGSRNLPFVAADSIRSTAP